MSSGSSELIVTSFRLPFVAVRKENGTIGRTESRYIGHFGQIFRKKESFGFFNITDIIQPFPHIHSPSHQSLSICPVTPAASTGLLASRYAVSSFGFTF